MRATLAMTDTRRIILNIAATYGCSLVSLCCGLFTVRWMLMALGEVDYGLFGVIGALMGFVAIFNEILAGGVRRFYGIAVGAGRADEVTAWFRVALWLHVAFAVILVAIGYPIGSWAIQRFIDVPANRIGDCLWVFRFSCAACFVGMVSVPFGSMYTAKQEIAERTGYSLVQTLMTFGFLGWLVWARGGESNLVPVAAAIATIGIGLNLALIVRSSVKYSECSLGKVSCFGSRVRELMGYSLCNAVQSVGYLLSVHGMAVFVNKAFGPIVNGALNVSNGLTGKAGTLSAAVQNAFVPVINSAYGAGDMGSVRKFALRMSKFSVLCIMVFALPLIVELDEVLSIWLTNPPKGTVEIASLFLCVMMADAFASGCRTAIYASGDLKRFTIRCESLLLLTLPVAGVMWWCGMGVWSIGASYLVVTALNVVGRVWFARGIVGVSGRAWARELLLPVLSTAALTLAVGVAARRLFSGRFDSQVFDVAWTVVACEIVFVPIVLLKVLSPQERQWIVNRILQRAGK